MYKFMYHNAYLRIPYGAKFRPWNILMNQGWENFDE